MKKAFLAILAVLTLNTPAKAPAPCVNKAQRAEAASRLPDFSANLNNPFSIRHSPANAWQGQTGQKNGFCVFDTPENGIRAGVKLLFNYMTRHGAKDIDDVLSLYLGPGDDRQKYRNACLHRGLGRVNGQTLPGICRVLVWLETSHEVPERVFAEALAGLAPGGHF